MVQIYYISWIFGNKAAKWQKSPFCIPQPGKTGAFIRFRPIFGHWMHDILPKAFIFIKIHWL
jgi:hypothetical protein